MGGRRKGKSTVKYSDCFKKRVAAAVKDHPCLWKKSDPNYCKRDVKAAAWDSIAEELNMTGNFKLIV